MSSKNTSGTDSSEDTASLPEENALNLSGCDTCTCSTNRRECMHCAVKQYEELVANIKKLSENSSRKKRKKKKEKKEKHRKRKTVVHQQNESCGTYFHQEQNSTMDSQHVPNCDTNAPQERNSCVTNYHPNQNSSSNFQLTEHSVTDSQRIPNCDINALREENGVTNYHMNQNSSSDLQLTEHKVTSSHHVPNCDINALQEQNSVADYCRKQSSSPDFLLTERNVTNTEQFPDSYADYQQKRNSGTNYQLNRNNSTNSQEDSIRDTRQFPNSNRSILQEQRCVSDFQDQSCSTDFQHGDELNMGNESCGTNRSSHSSIPDRLSESSCDNLEHFPNRNSDFVIGNSDSFIADQVKSQSPDAEMSRDSVTQDPKRSRRNSKRKRDMEDSCPVCGLTVRYSELESHFIKEVENLSHIAKSIRKPRGRAKEGVNTTYVQVKCNRENRLAAKVAKYAKKNEVWCPVCNSRLTGSENEINEHVNNCVEEDDYDSDINILDHDDGFEEYEFGDETRVRVVSLIPGGYRALHGQSSNSKPSDEDDDLNVDVDDTLTYGKPQYTELDVMHNTSSAEEKKQLEQLKRAVVDDSTAEPLVIECRRWTNDNEIKNEVATICGSSSGSISKSDRDESNNGRKRKDKENSQNAASDIINVLKERIKDLQEQNSVKCLVCLEPYTKPVVATTCWHVHCEECWLMTLGVKKLCPQCNSIVLPTSLRRIYL